MRRTVLGLLLFILGMTAFGLPQSPDEQDGRRFLQELREKMVTPTQVPSELQGSLASRLNLFLDAQAQGRWDYVSTLLGNFRNAYVRDVPYTAAHRACLISKMKASPMVEFNIEKVLENPYGSMFVLTPEGQVPMVRRAWQLLGEALFRGDSGTVKKRTSVIAYRDNEEWYFTPPALDNIIPDGLLRDGKEGIQLLIPTDCPLELIDLRVVIDSEDAKSRHVRFRLRNRTNQRITRFGYRMDDEQQNGAIEFGTGADLEPGGITKEFNEDYVLYLFWRCEAEGQGPLRIQIDHVGLADGTEWLPPKSAAPEKSPK